MAKFTPGALISEIRGKVSSTVFSKNAAGPMIRNRTTPINPRSPKQTQRRQALAALSAGWRSLTQNQRDGWNSLASSYPRTDSLGQTIFLTGAQLYILANSNLELIGGSAINSAPTLPSFPVLSLGAITVDEAAFTVGFDPDPVPADMELVVRASAPISAGKSFVGKSDFRFIESFPAAEVSPADINSAYEAVFGSKAGQAGQKIFVEIFLVSATSGIAGQSVRTSAVVA